MAFLMYKIEDILECIREMAPEELAEPWDNCGLIIEPVDEFAKRIIICLDVTQKVVEEAINSGANLIIAHHPLLFSPIKRIDMSSMQGTLLRELLRNNIALYAAHTNVDITYGGLNDLLAGLVGVEVPIQDETSEPLSYFRLGELPEALTVGEFNEQVRSRLKLENLIVSASAPSPSTEAVKRIKKVAVMCGSYSLDAAHFASLKADALLCGEIRYHDLLELDCMGVHIVQAGHHGSERFFINLVSKWITEKYPDANIHGFGFAAAPTKVHVGGIASVDV